MLCNTGGGVNFFKRIKTRVNYDLISCLMFISLSLNRFHIIFYIVFFTQSRNKYNKNADINAKYIMFSLCCYRFCYSRSHVNKYNSNKTLFSPNNF